MFINFMLRKPTGIQIQQKLILTLCKTGRRGLKSTRGIYIIRESLERGGRPSGVNRTTIKSGYTYYIEGTNAGQGILSILKQTSYSMCKCVRKALKAVTAWCFLPVGEAHCGRDFPVYYSRFSQDTQTKIK